MQLATASNVTKLIDNEIAKISKKFSSSLSTQEAYLRSIGLPREEIKPLLFRQQRAYENRVSLLKTNSCTAVQAALANTDSCPISVQLLDADLHGSKLPIRLTFDDRSLVLKYGDLNCYKLVEELVREGFDLNMKVASLTRDETEFGWFSRTWIREGDRGDPKRQAYGLGFLAAIVFYFNIFDIDYENYIMTPAGSIPIDLECFLYPLDNRAFSFSADFVAISNSVIGVDASNGRSIFSEYSDLHLSQNGFEIVRDVPRTEHPIRDEQGNIARVADYIREFSDGYNDTIRALIRNNERNAAILESLKLRSRKLFRPTSFYKLLVEEMSAYGVGLMREVFRGRIKIAGTPPTFPTIPITDWEFAQLSAGNIPIFHVDIHNCQIYSNYRPTRHAWFKSPFSQWREKILMLNEPRISTTLRMMVNRLVSADDGGHSRRAIPSV
ncbi:MULTISPECIES: DUF4135 domain-containing protein [Rhizobium]|uniref:Lantibiotic modifying enzyme n=1 Tax=Rhizobium miluonense TaxID=411945 RepID=A0ABU1SXB1_9HYPH|nr:MULTISPECIES: DUF4135 domain-containing protein [Rhizobium]MBB3428840.1 lantibiotic modifying enzyme [Rhizobium sp. BK312]MDR6903533.1 lantibiotic modifying enzyme [Rhizobium miluonense]